LSSLLKQFNIVFTIDKQIYRVIIDTMSNSLTTQKRNLTEKQQLFLDNILETKGNLKLSAELAGYSGNHYQVIKSLKDEIVELAQNVLAREAPSAAFKLVEVMSTPTSMPQANVKLQAAQTILDRVGIGKQERMQVDHNVSGGIFILPEKQTINIEEGEYENLSDNLCRS
jgi:hypothetical protein